MKNLIVAGLLTVIVLALPHPSQASGPVIGVPGYYDPATSTFVPMVAPKAIPLATFVRTGTVKVVIMLSIEPAIGTDEAISCQATLQAADASFENSASATGLVVRTGSAGSLTMSIPYQWTMAASGEPATITVNCTEGNESFTPGAVGHSIFFTAAPFTVPATAGAVTTKTLSASM